MIIFLYNFLAFLNAVNFLGNGYCAYKIYKLPHRWSLYISAAFFGDAINALIGLITFGFGPRPASVVWWTVILTILGRVAMTAGIAVTTLFFLGWINGVGKEEKK